MSFIVIQYIYDTTEMVWLTTLFQYCLANTDRVLKFKKYDSKNYELLVVNNNVCKSFTEHIFLTGKRSFSFNCIQVWFSKNSL